VRPGRAELGPEPVSQPVDDVLGACPVDRDRHRWFVVQPWDVAETHRAPGAELEPEEVLERAGHPGPPRLSVDRGQRDAVDQDPAGVGFVQLAQQLDQRRLPGAVLTDDRRHTAGR
jgi:hypothetical protein